MANTLKGSIYSDINANISVVGGRTLMLDEDAVLNSVINILSTAKGERLFDPEFGSQVPQLLFEPLDEDTAYLIKNALILAIRRWEPRVQLIHSRTSVIPNPDGQYYEVNLAMVIIGVGLDSDYSLFLRNGNAV